jgi:hypothetical protein
LAGVAEQDLDAMFRVLRVLRARAGDFRPADALLESGPQP